MPDLHFKLEPGNKNFFGYYFTSVLHIGASTKSTKKAKSRSSRQDNLARKTEDFQLERNFQLTGKGAVSREGDIKISLPEELTEATYQLKGIALFIYAPNGQELYSENIPSDKVAKFIESGEAYTIELAGDWQPVKLEHTDNRFSGQNVNLRGRVIVLSGKKLTGSHQVILIGNTDADEQFHPIFVSRTADSGYFFGAYPRGRYKEVYGIVGSKPEEKVMIRLENGRLPRQVLLLVDLHDDQLIGEEADIPWSPDVEDFLNDPETFKKDPSKDNCFDFTAPNRILQEHSFYTVVRTTDPEMVEKPALHRPKPSSRHYLDPPGKTKSTHKSRQEKGFVAEMTPTASLELDPQPSHEGNVAEEMQEEILSHYENPHVAFGGNLPDELPGLGGRTWVSEHYPIDWDEQEATFYQATTVAHGHILHYKTKWYADGYSLGNLLYSLPLAPCQKKQIAIVDWERKDRGATKDSLQARDQIYADLVHNRDIDEIVEVSLNEEIDARSRSKTTSGGGGGGISGSFFGFFSLSGGGSGATSTTNSSAFQAGDRSVGARSAQALRDRITQSANSIRNQRSTVITSVDQGETSTVTTEVVANHNHCHAMTVEYFEVLRHMKIVTDLADVQECLFIPLLISSFDHTKILKHQQALKRSLKDKTLEKAFEAIERIENGSDLPQNRFADEYIEDIRGTMFVTLELVESEKSVQTAQEEYNSGLQQMRVMQTDLAGSTISNHFYDTNLKHLEPKEREANFQENIAPGIARDLINDLQFIIETNNNEDQLPLDATLISPYERGKSLGVDIGLSGAVLSSIRRSDIKGISIKVPDLEAYGLSGKSRIIPGTGQISYTTRHLDGELVRRSSFGGDLAEEALYLDALRLTAKELKNPREEDREIADKLVEHLNAHLEYYHKFIWLSMDANKRHRLLDRFNAPNSTRSLASVVENRVIGIAGNSLIMPVARGFRLDPTFEYPPLLEEEKEQPETSRSGSSRVVEDYPEEPAVVSEEEKEEKLARELNVLLNYYAPLTPIPPDHIALPTKGVFAEAKLGSCNSCEEIDDSRFWKWDEAPCGDEPTPILPASTDSRNDPNRQAPQSQGFSNPIINMQNAPAAPDPTGMQNAMQLMSNPNLFKDLTGLEGTQANSIQGLNESLKAGKHFSDNATKLAMQQSVGKDMDRLKRSLDKSVSDGTLTRDEANKWMNQAYNNWTGGGKTSEKESLSNDPGVQRLLENASQSDNSSVSLQRDGEKVEVSMENHQETPVEAESIYKFYNVPLIPQPTKNSCWAAAMAMLVSYQRQEMLSPGGLVKEVDPHLDLAGETDWNTVLGVKDHFGFDEIDLPSNASLQPTPQDWYDWLMTKGPLWVTVNGDPSHALIVNGIGGDLTQEGTFFYVLNPWDKDTQFDDSDPVYFNPPNKGKRIPGDKNYLEFAAEFGTVDLSNFGDWRVLYLPETHNITETMEWPDAPPPGQVDSGEDYFGEFNLKKGDRDWITGVSGKEKEGDIKKTPVYEGVSHSQLAGSDSDSYVRKLQECLKELGFLVVGEPDGVFTKNTEYALREFQIYAKMGHVAQKYRDLEDLPAESNLHDRYLYTLRSIVNQKRLPEDFPVSGELNAPGLYRLETAEALQFWKENEYRCPVVIEAYRDEDIETTVNETLLSEDLKSRLPITLFTNSPIAPLVDAEKTPVDYLRKPMALDKNDKPVMPKNENAWAFNDYPKDPSYRFFAYDFTKYYNYGPHQGYRYNYDHPVDDLEDEEKPDVAVLGFYQKKEDESRGGPDTKGEKHTWYTARITEESLFGFSSPDPKNHAFFKFMQSLSQQESSGYWDGMNGWDSGLISMAPYHHMLAERGTNSWKLRGEATGILGKLKELHPDSFSDFIDFFGVNAIIPTDTFNGTYGVSYKGDRGLLLHTSQIGVYTDILEESYSNTDNAEYNFLKSWHWFYRWLMFMRTNEEIKKVMYNAAKIRLKWVWEYVQHPIKNPEEKGVTGNPPALKGKFRKFGIMALLQRTHMAGSSTLWINGALRLQEGAGNINNYKDAIIRFYNQKKDTNKTTKLNTLFTRAGGTTAFDPTIFEITEEP